MRSRYRLVVDTNVLVSALLTPKGRAREAFSKVSRAGFFLLSEATFQEVEEVIYRERFDRYVTDEERARFLSDLLAKSIFAAPAERIRACSDPDDDMFIELAVSGSADYLITGNVKDFPPSPFRGIPILTPAEFLEMDLSATDSEQ